MSINIFTQSILRCETWNTFPKQFRTLSNRAQTFSTPSADSSPRTVNNKPHMGKTKSKPAEVTASAGADKSRVLIISGYTCIGKTFFCNNEELRRSLDLGEVVDLDSSRYPRDNFPANYLEAIRREADAPAPASRPGAARVILVSTFPGVATQLVRDGYYVAQVYPHGSADCKREWLSRLERREAGGRESRLYRLVSDQWDAWYEEMGQRSVSHSRSVSAKDYLSSVIQEIFTNFQDYQRGGGGAEACGHEARMAGQL